MESHEWRSRAAAVFHAGVIDDERAIREGGAFDGDEQRERSRGTRWALVGLALIVAGLWGWALVYSVIRKDPERLSAAEHGRIEQVCTTTIKRLRALPPVSSPPTNAKVAQRARAETGELTRMVADLRAVHPQRAAAAQALSKWLDDWDSLLAVRHAYAREVAARGRKAEIVIPAANGTAITVRMNRYAESKSIEDCDTTALGAENVNSLAKGA
jgi:hypothetical protein